MVAWFEELGVVHPVYSTWAMVRHMELASRKVILPFLEPGEDAVGYSVNVTHFAPTPVGMQVTVHATLQRIEGLQRADDAVAFNPLQCGLARGRTCRSSSLQITCRTDFAGSPPRRAG